MVQLTMFDSKNFNKKSRKKNIHSINVIGYIVLYCILYCYVNYFIFIYVLIY